MSIYSYRIAPLFQYGSHFHALAPAWPLQASFVDNVIAYQLAFAAMQSNSYPGGIGIEQDRIDQG